MHEDEKMTDRGPRSNVSTEIAGGASRPSRTIFSLPAPLRHLFDQFPFTTYAANKLPQRAPQRGQRAENVLYIFASEHEASRNQPSCNPSCLKWQAFLKFNSISFRTQPANNHASPTGVLPFLLPSARIDGRPSPPVPSNKIQKWVSSVGGEDKEEVSVRQEAYSSLLDHTIRNAWLYHLYLDDANFAHVARPSYVAPASSNWAVQVSLATQLREAARTELLKSNVIIDWEELRARAVDAFRALSALLGQDTYFFGRQNPGIFDASVFAYTHLLLSEDLHWANTTLGDALRTFPNLVDQRNRLLNDYFRS